MSRPSTFRVIVLKQTAHDDVRLSATNPRRHEAPATHGQRSFARSLSLVASKPLMSGSVFQKVNHLLLMNKITLQSLVNMNDHKKTWFLTDRKPISRSGGLIFFLSLFKLGKFGWNRPSSFAKRLLTDRQPRFSGPRRSQYIQSMKMTECKN